MFRSPQSALAWAYTEVTHPIYALSGINRMREQQRARLMPNSTTEGLTPFERKLQAYDIIGIAARLPYKPGRELVAARYEGVKPERLRSIGGRLRVRLGQRIGRDVLVHVVSSYIDGGANYRILRRMLGCRDREALETRNALYDELDAIHKRTMAELEAGLQRAGLLPGNPE